MTLKISEVDLMAALDAEYAPIKKIYEAEPTPDTQWGLKMGWVNSKFATLKVLARLGAIEVTEPLVPGNPGVARAAIHNLPNPFLDKGREPGDGELTVI